MEECGNGGMGEAAVAGDRASRPATSPEQRLPKRRTGARMRYGYISHPLSRCGYQFLKENMCLMFSQHDFDSFTSKNTIGCLNFEARV